MIGIERWLWHTPGAMWPGYAWRAVEAAADDDLPTPEPPAHEVHYAQFMADLDAAAGRLALRHVQRHHARLYGRVQCFNAWLCGPRRVRVPADQQARWKMDARRLQVHKDAAKLDALAAAVHAKDAMTKTSEVEKAA